jgi:hypothetical protein
MGFWDALFKNSGDDAAKLAKKLGSDALGGAAHGAAGFFTAHELKQHFNQGHSTQQTPQIRQQTPQIFPISGEYFMPGEMGVWRTFSDGYRRRVR